MPELSNSQPIGSVSLMTAMDYEAIFRRLHANAYFTNHGPLACEFESQLQSFCRIDHVVATGNESLALLIAMAAVERHGDVVIPAWGGRLPSQMARWLRRETRFCDVDPATHQASIETLSKVVDDQVAIVCLVEMYGSRCDQAVIQWVRDQGKDVVVLSSDSFAAQASLTQLSEGDVAVVAAYGHADAVTVYGFGSDKIVSCSQGGAIATNDSELAKRCRNIRSSYGARETIAVTATCNGRFSEFQAGVGLTDFSYLPRAIDRNQTIASIYDAAIEDCSWAEKFSFAHTCSCNGQCYPMLIQPTASRSQCDRLRGMGVQFAEGVPSISEPAQYPVACGLQSRVAFLPVNNASANGLAAAICQELLRSA